MEIINILILRFSYENIGGVERQILRIGKELNMSNKFNVILGTDRINSSLANEFGKIGKVFIMDLNFWSIIKSTKSIGSLIKVEKINIIQSHLFHESIICRIIKFRYPKIHHVFRAQTYIDCAWITNTKKNLYHLLDFLTSKYVTIYIANGPQVEYEVINRSRISKVKVINIINGTEEIGEPDKLTSKPLPYSIAMVSNLLEKKGHDILIDALAKLKKRGLEINVRLIGAEINSGLKKNKDSFKNQLIQKAKENNVLKQLEFYGYSDQVAIALQEIPIVVLPSDSEGVPNSIIEAMSLKKIVIASDVGAVNVIIDDGVNGFIHPSRDSVSFSLILEKVFKEDVNSLNIMRENAYQHWKYNFSLQKMIYNLQKVYSELKVP